MQPQMGSTQDEGLVGNEETESEEEDDSIMYSTVDLYVVFKLSHCLSEWMAHWESWRNNVAWRQLWLTLKISSLEHQMGGTLPTEGEENFKAQKRQNRKRKAPKTATKPSMYVPTMNTLEDHPFLSLQVPRKTYPS
jgi:hypothetical protein